MITDPDSSPIIIFGAPRSGTTYLSDILNHHPDIAITNEIRLMMWMHQSLNVLTQEDEMIYNERQDFIDHLHKEYPSLIRGFYKTIRPTARYWGDKNPHYAAPQHKGCLETIVSIFPGAQFIHIIRDGRDVVSSILRMGWADFQDAHEYWKNQIDIGSAFGRSQPSNRYFEVRYEDLISNDAAIARTMFDFLGIEMPSVVEEFCNSQQGRRTTAGFPTRDLSAGITKSVWAELLTLEEQTRSLESLGPHLVHYGYESAATLSEKQQMLSELHAESSESSGIA